MRIVQALPGAMLSIACKLGKHSYCAKQTIGEDGVIVPCECDCHRERAKRGKE